VRIEDGRTAPGVVAGSAMWREAGYDERVRTDQGLGGGRVCHAPGRTGGGR